MPIVTKLLDSVTSPTTSDGVRTDRGKRSFRIKLTGVVDLTINIEASFDGIEYFTLFSQSYTAPVDIGFDDNSSYLFFRAMTTPHVGGTATVETRL